MKSRRNEDGDGGRWPNPRKDSDEGSDENPDETEEDIRQAQADGKTKVEIIKKIKQGLNPPKSFGKLTLQP